MEVSSQTKDSQFLKLDLDIKYRVNKDNAYEVFKQFRTMKNIDQNLILPTVQKSIEMVTTKYNIIEALGSKRNAIYKDIEEELENRFANTGIEIYGVTFLDTDGGAEIENVIKAEAVARKNVDVAEQKKAEAEINMQREIINAEAQKQVAILKAEAEAEAVKIIQEQLSQNPVYIEYIKWSKWNGQLPQVQGGNAIVDLK